MRQLLSFACEGAQLAATLDRSTGTTGLLLVTGGSQTRVGSHRMYERLAAALAQEGFTSLRFDRRGVGDSEGEDPGYRESMPDIKAAASALRAQCPDVKRVIGFGLCDGATALALSAGAVRFDGLILVNPWLVEAASGEPPPAAIRSHYRDRLLSLEGWKKLLTGSIDYRKLFKGILKSAQSAPSTLAGQVAAALRAQKLPVEFIMADRDATAIAAGHEMKSNDFKGLHCRSQSVSTDSHTFARPADPEALLNATLSAVRRLEASANEE